MLAASFAIAMAGHAIAQETTVTCSYVAKLEASDSVPLIIARSCFDAGTPMEACASFSIAEGKVKGKVASYKIPTEKSGGKTVLKFKPIDASVWHETSAGDTSMLWALSLIDNSGGNAAEERILLVDPYELKAQSKLMTSAQFQSWKKAGADPMKENYREMGKVVKTCK